MRHERIDSIRRQIADGVYPSPLAIHGAVDALHAELFPQGPGVIHPSARPASGASSPPEPGAASGDVAPGVPPLCVVVPAWDDDDEADYRSNRPGAVFRWLFAVAVVVGAIVVSVGMVLR